MLSQSISHSLRLVACLLLCVSINTFFTLFSSSIFAASLDSPNWTYSSSENFDSYLFIDGYSLSSSGFASASMSTNIGVVNSGDILEFNATVNSMISLMHPQSDAMIRDNLFINAGVKVTGSSDEIIFDLHDGGSYAHNSYLNPIYTPEWVPFMGMDYETYIDPEAIAVFLEESGVSLDEAIEPWDAEMTDWLDGLVDLTPLTGQNAQLTFILQAHTSEFYYDVGMLDMDIVSFGISNSTVVPVPAAAWLFGSALAGLGVVRRKK